MRRWDSGEINSAHIAGERNRIPEMSFSSPTRFSEVGIEMGGLIAG